MTLENLDASIQAVKRWAAEEIDRLVYSGTRPVSTCSTVEAAIREAAIARGNTIAHSAEIAEIESVLHYVSECLISDFYEEARPAAPSPQHEDAIRRFAS